MRNISVDQILTSNKQRLDAVHLYKQFGSGAELHRHLVKLIEPHMSEINKRLGQENDVNYLAYAVEHVLTLTAEKRETK
jgi:hypothetical protein